MGRTIDERSMRAELVKSMSRMLSNSYSGHNQRNAGADEPGKT
jgi:hypothetical protein